MAESLGTAKLTLSVDDAQFRAGLQRAEGIAKGAGAAISQGLALAGVSLGAAALVAFAKSTFDVGLAADAAERRLNLLAGRFGESAQAAKVAAVAAKQLGITNQEASSGIAELYGRLRPLGLSLGDIETLYTGLSAASKNLGLDAGSTSAAITQLAQGLGSGSLQGDELRSVLENLPPVAQEVAKTLGVSVGQLKLLGSQGKITNDVILESVKRLKDVELQGLDLNTPQQNVKDLGNAFNDLQVSIAKANQERALFLANGATVVVKTTQLLIDPKARKEFIDAYKNIKLDPAGSSRAKLVEAAIADINKELDKGGDEPQLVKRLKELEKTLERLKGKKLDPIAIGAEQLNTIEGLTAKVTKLQTAGKNLDFGSNAFVDNARQVFDLQQKLANITADQFTEKDKIVSASKEELNAAIALSAYQDRNLTQTRAIAQSRQDVLRAAKEARAATENVDIARRSNDPKRLEAATLALNDSGNRLKTAMITGGIAAKNALLEAAEATKNAVKSLANARRNAFDLLPNYQQQALKDQAIASIEKQISSGELDQAKVNAFLGVRSSSYDSYSMYAFQEPLNSRNSYQQADPQKLFDVAGKADAIAEANKALTLATQDQTKATIEQSKVTQAFNEASATLVGVLVNAILYRQPTPQPYLP